MLCTCDLSYWLSHVQYSIVLYSISVLFFFKIPLLYRKKKSQLYNLRKISPQNRCLMSFIHMLIYVKVCGSKFWYPDLQSNARSCCERSQLQIWNCPTGSVGAVILHVVDDIVNCKSFSCLIVHRNLFIVFLIFIFCNYEIISTCVWLNFREIFIGLSITLVLDLLALLLKSWLATYKWFEFWNRKMSFGPFS